MLFWRPFKPIEEKDISDAISDVERFTTSEIRVHVDKYCKGSAALKAQNLFKHLGMEKTKNRNGVLIYISIKDHKFYIYGDVQINEKVDGSYWDKIAGDMLPFFESGHCVRGICQGIETMGQKLKELFPSDGDQNPNELPNNISYE